jgi:hypothetical protein
LKAQKTNIVAGTVFGVHPLILPFPIVHSLRIVSRECLLYWGRYGIR